MKIVNDTACHMAHYQLRFDFQLGSLPPHTPPRILHALIPVPLFTRPEMDRPEMDHPP